MNKKLRMFVQCLHVSCTHLGNGSLSFILLKLFPLSRELSGQFLLHCEFFVKIADTIFIHLVYVERCLQFWNLIFLFLNLFLEHAYCFFLSFESVQISVEFCHEWSCAGIVRLTCFSMCNATLKHEFFSNFNLIVSNLFGKGYDEALTCLHPLLLFVPEVFDILSSGLHIDRF